jgi:dipeptidase D
VLMALDLDFSLAVASIDGGGLRNAIPREARAVFGVPREEAAELAARFEEQVRAISQEYRTTDPELRVRLEQTNPGSWLEVLPPDLQSRLLRALQAVPNGIYRLSPEVPGLVQTSSNLARLLVGERKLHAACLCRGSVDSEKLDMACAISSALELGGLEARYEGSYPGWSPRPDAGIVRLMKELYQEMFGQQPQVAACHAGLECGILGTNYPDMEMISFGPNIRGAHSPDERVQISSVQKTWSLLKATLARL